MKEKMINIKSEREIEILRKSCKLAANTLQFIEPYLKEGVSTFQIDKLCHEFIMDHGAYPSCLNYHGFPKSVCTSINEVICHGIPSHKDVLKDGDIINVDVTALLNKFHGDTNRTFLIGNVRKEVEDLVDRTYKAMFLGIDEIAPGKYTGDIGDAIEQYALEFDYGVVEEYCGHGIGREFHEEPQIVHFGPGGVGAKLKKGMTFTVEPMINLGTRKNRVLKDKWTVVTKDKMPSAQFEHTIVVTDDGYEVLTIPDKPFIRNFERL